MIDRLNDEQIEQVRISQVVGREGYWCTKKAVALRSDDGAARA